MSEEQANFDPRSRSPLPLAADDPRISIPPGHVSIYHPGYEDEREIFRFVAYNKSKDGLRWVDYNFVHDMCMAVTGHRSDGYFTLGKKPNMPKVGNPHGILVEGRRYYFHLEGDTEDIPEQYAVIRSFRDYVFSPDHVGDHWHAAVPSGRSVDGQIPGACAITGIHPVVEEAHLIPATEWHYWKANGLHRYNLQPGPRTQGRETSTVSNKIILSPTLHKLFDAGHFVFVPVGGCLQCQWIRASDCMALKLHSRPVRGGCHMVSPEYAYLACVYRVVGLMQEEFLERGSRETLVMTGDGKSLLMTGFELGQYKDQQMRNTSPSKSGSRGGSPQKRPRAEDEDASDLDSAIDVDEWTRGRRRTVELEAIARDEMRKKRRLNRTETTPTTDE